MSLPAIDIPLKLPFEVPLLAHPVFVHFAIAIPVIVFLLEVANIKARNRAVSVTSLFLMTLALLVYAGAFFTGKADGSHAFAMLSSDAQEELKFHKLLGTYMVYGIGVLYILKILAMLVKRPWARDMFIAFLLIFVGVMFKQGKDGGELVYEYGVNVEPVTKLQDRIDEMEYDIDDLKEELKKAKAAAAAPAASEASAQEAPAAEAPAAPESPAASETPVEAAHEAVQEAEQSAQEAAESAHEAAEHAAEAAHDAAAATEEAAHEATDTAHEAVDNAHEAAHDAADSATGATHEAMPETTHEETTPVAIPTH
ncbi:DUF2231 domain-containing protein [Hydrogenimonas sp.]